MKAQLKKSEATFEKVKLGDAFIVASGYGKDAVYIVAKVTAKQFSLKQHRGTGTSTDTYWKERGNFVGYNASRKSILRPATDKDIKEYEERLDAEKAQSDTRARERDAIQKKGEDLVAPLADGPFAGTVRAEWVTNTTPGPSFEVNFYGLSEEQAKLLIERLKGTPA